MRRVPLGVSSNRPSRWSMRPRLLELLGQLGQPVQRLGGILAQAAGHLVQVDLGQRGRRVGGPEVPLELVEVPQPAGGVRGLAHAHRVVAAEPEPLLPPGVGEGLLQVARQPVDLPPQVHVLEQGLGQALELGPLFGRHRVPHGLGGGHPGGQLLEELVEVLRVAGEQVAELLHERLEAGVDRLARLALLDHPVEGVEGLAHVLELGRVRVRQGLGHLVEVGLRHLLAELLHEFLEVLAGLGGHELVVLQPADLAGQVVGEQVQLHAALGGHLVGDLLAALVARVAGVGLEALDAQPLLAQDVLQFVGDLGVGPTQVTLFEQFLSLHPQLVEQLAQALDLVAVGRAPPTVEHPLEGLLQVPVGQEVIGQLLQDGVGVVGRRLLGSVPPPVVVAPGHPRPR